MRRTDGTGSENRLAMMACTVGLDVHLADGDGKGISDVMSESDDLQVTKIIAMSSKLTDGQVAQLRHQGFDGALRKPFTVRQVIEAIEGAHAVVY